MGAKSSKLDKLHELFVAELTRQLQDGNVDPETGAVAAPSASFLAVVGNFLGRSGVKPTNDSPTIAELARSYELPFKDDGSLKKAN